MNNEQRRMRHGERPTQPLDWNDKPDLLAMRAGVSEIQREIERARSAGLTMLALPIETANAACCYVVHLGERVGEKLNGAPAEQASKQVPTIDTPEFRQLLSELLDAAEAGEKANDPMLYKPARDRFIAHIDAKLAGQSAAPLDFRNVKVVSRSSDQGLHLGFTSARACSEFERDAKALAGQPAAPVAATEQAIPEGWKLVPLDAPLGMAKAFRHADKKHDRFLDGYAAMLAAAPKPPLSTPVDAGAGQATKAALTDGRIFHLYHHTSAVLDFARAIEREVLARLSTPAAPVTAEPVAIVEQILRRENNRLREQLNQQRPAFLLNGTRFKLNFSQRGNVDVFHNYAAELQGRWVALVPAKDDMHLSTVAAPVSPQPAAQVPSIGREKLMVLQGMADCMDMVRQELIEAGIIDKSVAPMFVANAVASHIAALKSQPAAAHAAHDQKGGA